MFLSLGFIFCLSTLKYIICIIYVCPSSSKSCCCRSVILNRQIAIMLPNAVSNRKSRTTMSSSMYQACSFVTSLLLFTVSFFWLAKLWSSRFSKFRSYRSVCCGRKDPHFVMVMAFSSLQGFWGKLQRFIPCLGSLLLVLLLLKWRSSGTDYFHALRQDRSIAAQRTDELRVSSFPGIVPTLCQDSIFSPLRLLWVKGVCMFRCNLPPTLLAEWPGSFTCHRAKTRRSKSQHRKLTSENFFVCLFYFFYPNSRPRKFG